MEQPNMMMGGMPPQNVNMNSMQRPQQGNAGQQLHAKIMDTLRRKLNQLPAGWQSTFDVGQRAGRIMQLVSGLRMLQPDTAKCVTIAENFEDRVILESPSKEVYIDKMAKKMSEITQKRQQNAQGMQPGQMGMPMNNNIMGMPQNNVANMNNMQNGGMGGMNMNMNMGMGMNTPNGGMGMHNGQMNMDGGQQFPAQLQRQMQPSPLPPQQQPQPQNNTLDPSALQNPQRPPQMANMNQQNGQQQQQQQPQPQQQANMNQGGQTQAANQPPAFEILQNAKKMYSQMPEDKKSQLRSNFLSSLNEQQRQAVTVQGGDPLFKFLLQKSREILTRQRAAAADQVSQGVQQNGGGMQMGNNMGMSSNAQQAPASQAGAQNIDFSNILGQQANAMKSQESGELVVPASNNSNFGMGGQMNMPQSVNPQMLGNQNQNQGQNNQGSNNPQIQMQMMALQQEKQRQQRAQMQTQLAQQQALAQQQQAHNQLRGQPGGLNTPNALNGGQVNSPAMNMNMLNRPMVPPGQTTPSTPQPSRPQGMPQTPANPANQLAQHHQTMVNQSNQQMNHVGQGQGLSQREQLLASLPQEAQEKLRALQPPQLNNVLQRIANQRREHAMNSQQGQPNMIPNMNPGGPQMGNQQQMMAGMRPNMGSAIPGFNAQPPPNQQQQQPAQNEQAALQQRLAQHQQAVLRQRAIDSKPFPKPVLQNLGIHVPDHVTEWGKLRQHIMQNQAVLPGNLIDKLNAAQNQWFGAHPEELRQAMEELQQRMQMQNAGQQATNGQQQQQQPQQQPPATRPPSSMGNGQAPPAQMVPPTAPMQQTPSQNPGDQNMNQSQPRPQQPTVPSAQEVALFRQKVPSAQGLTDDQIKNALMRRKAQQPPNQSMQMQQNARNASIQRAQALANGTQPGNGAQGPPPQLQQAQRTPQPQQGANQQMNGQAQGLKRPQASSDEVMEIPNPNVQPVGAPQAPAMQLNQSQQPKQSQMPPRHPTQEELSKMNPQQRMVFAQRMQQWEALRKAQGLANNQGSLPFQQPQQPQAEPAVQQRSAQQQMQGPTTGPQQGPTQQQVEARVNVLWQEVQRANPKGHPIQLDSKGLEQVQASLKKMWLPMLNIDKTFPTALRTQQFGEQKVKEAMRAKLIVQQNASDGNGTTKDYLAVTPVELKKFEVFIAQYFQALKSLKERQDAFRAQAAQAAANGAQVQQPQAQPSKPQQKPQPAPPLDRKPSQQNHVRKASANTKAPPAPTENKSFDWGPPRPDGIPKYDSNRSELTADKLKFPPQKKRRTGTQPDSQGSTPAGQITTPGAATTGPNLTAPKAPSPGQVKKVQPQKAPEAERPKFKCDELQCDASINGFETQELLKKHKESVHQPIEDPLMFLTENLDAAEKAYNVEKNVPAANEAKAQAHVQAQRKAPQAAKAGIKKETAPKQEIGAPARKHSAAKAVSQSGTAGKEVGDNKAPAIATGAPEREKTLMESMAEKIGFSLSAEHVEDSAVAETTVDRVEDVWLDVLASNMHSTENGGFINDWADLADVTDWGLQPELDSSPELTPSDGTSQSSRESDISATERLRINFEWDPFGNGDTAVPNALMQTLGLGEQRGDDTLMPDAGRERKNDDGEGKKADDQWNWSSDVVDWDAIFGPNAGLEEDKDAMELSSGMSLGFYNGRF